jgi:hypothetical protein
MYCAVDEHRSMQLISINYTRCARQMRNWRVLATLVPLVRDRQLTDGELQMHFVPRIITDASGSCS